jgi:hypothetical protein
MGVRSPLRKSADSVHMTTFILTPIDETFDVGLDTRTAVDDSYKLSFRFTGTTDKLTFNLGPEQLSAADKKAAEEALARAHD